MSYMLSGASCSYSSNSCGAVSSAGRLYNAPSSSSLFTDFFKAIPTMTPDDFDTQLNNLNYWGSPLGLKTIYSGFTFMGFAALHGNIALIRHLHTLDPTLVDLGNNQGETPLLQAVYNNQIVAAETLIELRTNLNLATTQAFTGDRGDTPVGATCLWVAIENAKSLPLTKLLLKAGASFQLPLSVNGQAIFDRAKKELAEERAAIETGIQTVIGTYPKVLLDMIYKYV